MLLLSISSLWLQSQSSAKKTGASAQTPNLPNCRDQGWSPVWFPPSKSCFLLPIFHSLKYPKIKLSYCELLHEMIEELLVACSSRADNAVPCKDKTKLNSQSLVPALSHPAASGAAEDPRNLLLSPVPPAAGWGIPEQPLVHSSKKGFVLPHHHMGMSSCVTAQWEKKTKMPSQRCSTAQETQLEARKKARKIVITINNICFSEPSHFCQWGSEVCHLLPLIFPFLKKQKGQGSHFCQSSSEEEIYWRNFSKEKIQQDWFS